MSQWFQLFEPFYTFGTIGTSGTIGTDERFSMIYFLHTPQQKKFPVIPILGELFRTSAALSNTVCPKMGRGLFLSWPPQGCETQFAPGSR